MSTARASIELQGKTMRYTEVERTVGPARLLRLGACEFEFDAARALLSGREEHVTTLAEAIGDVFAGTQAQSMQLVLHPPFCCSFFTPLPAGMDATERRERLHREAFLVAGQDSRPLRLTIAPAGTVRQGGQALEWWHVLALPERTYGSVERITSKHAGIRFELRESGQGVAAVAAELLARAAEKDDRAAGDALVLGAFETHAEITYVRPAGGGYFSVYAPAGEAEDVAYFALALLRRLGADETALGAIYHYGEGFDTRIQAGLVRLFEQRPQLLNPVPLIDLDPDSLSASFRADAFAPCIGAAVGPS